MYCTHYFERHVQRFVRKKQEIRFPQWIRKTRVFARRYEELGSEQSTLLIRRAARCSYRDVIYCGAGTRRIEPTTTSENFQARIQILPERLLSIQHSTLPWKCDVNQEKNLICDQNVIQMQMKCAIKDKWATNILYATAGMLSAPHLSVQTSNK